ncbi:type II toxin-antitoxin system RelE/ParE family toxin [Candidatus Daviesbacteria bacterium]|nr:type II toxin-antitoxin system RelE/ParE family toxin [Candidatus Daviesbacteria bacterium]
MDPAVFKSLQRFPQKDSKRTVAVIESLQNNPFSGDIQKMKGEDNVWRRRVGSYRIFYEILSAENIIHVFHIERRTTQTY